jgi:hypothetical protein
MKDFIIIYRQVQKALFELAAILSGSIGQEISRILPQGAFP